MTELKENLIRLITVLVFLGLILFGLSFFPQALKNTPNDSQELDASQTVIPEQKEIDGVLSEETVYGFSIGGVQKAYPLSAFRDKDVIYDTLLGEPVIIGPSPAYNGGIIMTHAETGEVFKPVEVQWGTWHNSYPNTLIYSEE
ncbi:MAG: hypothetical protein U1D31_02075 [Patescibacteria group bacterium]|nr:hypothetical protein [bacterium]MDZ4240891.1 hypothetical protein [Patescibacteria group bacterium]